MPNVLFAFYVPESHLDRVKSAVFQAGAGNIGNYSNCCWQILGQGQFIPGAGSQPAEGERFELSCVPEYLVQVTCKQKDIASILEAFKASHPYEEPAYFITPLLSVEV